MSPDEQANERGRLQALASYQALDTPPEFQQDALTELAAEICRCPVALVSLVDERRQWFKSKYGLPAHFTECPREVTVCNTTICSNDLLYVPNLEEDERFRTLPIVTGEPFLRFYCGMPLINKEGHALGTLCVVDFEPRELSPSQREAIRRLAQQAMAGLELRRQLIERDTLLADISEAKAAAEQERQRSDSLLQRILPAQVACELKEWGKVAPQYHESVTVLFADFKDFTRLTEGSDPAALIGQLNANFARFDEIAEQNHLETIKTIGDAYLCVGGLFDNSRTHALDACVAGLQMQRFLADANRQREKLRLQPWELRIGINTGPVIAALVGTRRFTYDVWGNTVNVAQRLEESCDPGRVNISASTLHHVTGMFEIEGRGAVSVKHLGAVDMYFLSRIRPEYASDPAGQLPNKAFWQAAGR